MKNHRRIRRILVSAGVLVLIVGGGELLKTIVLRQVRGRIESTLHYGKIRLDLLPPAIIIEDVRSASASPFFTAKRVVLRISAPSLFKRDKPLTVLIERPVLRIRENPAAAAGRPLDLRLPFAVENGYIEDGEFDYWSPSVSVRASGVRAVFRQTEELSALQAFAAENSVFLPSMSHPVSGQSRIVVEGRGKDLLLRSFVFEGKAILAKARGTASSAPGLNCDLRVSLRLPAEWMADYLDLPFVWGGRVSAAGSVVRRGEKWTVDADLASTDLLLDDIAMGNVEGPLAFRSGARASLRLAARNPRRPTEYIDLQFGGGPVEGRARSFHLDPILKDVRIPWPVRSPASGTFQVDHGRVQVKASFDDDPGSGAEGSRYPVRGAVDFVWDGKTKTATFSSPKLETGFASLKVEGRVAVDRDLSVTLNGPVDDVRQSREFTALLLGAPLGFPEIRGRGTAEIKILGAFEKPRIGFSFSLAPAGFAKFDAAAVDGTAEVWGGEMTGSFKVNDPDMRGDLRLNVRAGETEFGARVEDGLVEKILPAIDLKLPLAGRAAGDVTVVLKGSDVRVDGRLTSPVLRLADVDWRDVETGLEWRKDASELVLSKLRAGLFGGIVRGQVRFGLASRLYDIDVGATGLDLSTLAPDIKGRADLYMKGNGSLSDRPIAGTFAVHGLRYATVGPADAAGALDVGFHDDRLTVKAEGRLDPEGGDFSAVLSDPENDGHFLLNLKGRLRNPDLVLPWKGVKAEIGYLVDVRGSASGTKVNGAIDIKGSLLPFPGFPHALTGFSGLLRVQDNIASLRSFQGKMADGDVQATGDIRLGKAGIESIDLRADGKSLNLAILDKTRTLADGSLRLEGSDGRMSLSGDFQIKQLFWRREFSGPFLVSAASSPSPRTERSALEAMALDIRLHADDNVLIENSLGKIRARFDVTLSGTVEAPVLLGEVEGLNGEFYFQDRKFRLVRGRVSFFNTTSFEPYLDLRGETFLKDYRVTFAANGVLDRLRPEFTSSPSLPPEDVLALLALGESFKRTYSYDASTQIGTGSLLSFQLAEDAKKRAEKLFSLDSIRIDPFVLGASTEMTARLTVGKKLSSNINLLYSTNLTSQREELVRLEWEFSNSFSLVGLRDERGRLSFDAKIRRRF